MISRAGASSIADISVIGRPAIFVPLAAALRDEQTANAAGLVEAGAAILMKEDALTALDLARNIHAILTEPGRGQMMADLAKSYGKPEATQSLVLLVEELGEKAQARKGKRS